MRENMRFEIRIPYDGCVRRNYIFGEGNDLEDALIDLLSGIEKFKDEFEGNNIDNGGNTAFTEDARILYKSLGEIMEEIERYLEI